MKGTTSSSSSMLSYHVYSTRSTLVPCGPAQRDTRLCLPGKSRLFGIGRRPLHARIIVNSKGGHKSPRFTSLSPTRSAWSTRCACMIPGIVTETSVSRNKGFLGLSSPPQAIVNNAKPRAGFSKLVPRINDAIVFRADALWEIRWKYCSHMSNVSSI